jgi:dienelactone hydrolase
MNRNQLHSCLWFGICLMLLTVTANAVSQASPDRDRRAEVIQDLNTPRQFPALANVGEWRERSQDIRRQVLVSCGLWPMPPRSPLNPVVSVRMERDGYSVEKVYFQTYPGFYLAGNLYRPLGKGNGPFPAILSPHGHWQKGRLQDDQNVSVPGRCINFAKQGMIAFSYDMIGYNDTLLVPKHDQFPRDPEYQLWNLSLMGLQTWNSIRALDFLVSLPGVDARRIACTGESGGGTQTFMVSSADDRVSVSAPVVMVSHSMQGGCLCENAPGLRVEYSNMEISAAAAPRPQIIVGASGDWTKTTMTIEGPSISKVYRMLGKPHQFSYALFSFNHNYNQTSREAVYLWFNRWLLKHPDPGSVKELSYVKEPDESLRVWPDGHLPNDALDASRLLAAMEADCLKQWHALCPRDPASCRDFKDLMKPAWKTLLQLRWPEQNALWMDAPTESAPLPQESRLFYFGAQGVGNRLPASLWIPGRNPRNTIVVLVDPAGQKAFLDAAGKPQGLADTFLTQRYQVLLLDVFQTGALYDEGAAAKRNYWTNLFTTYNRTDAQERVQDLVTACQLARLKLQARRVVLCGTGKAGLWALLAAPAANAVIADAAQVDVSDTAALLDRDLFMPGLRRYGGIEGLASVAAPNPLLVHHYDPHFNTNWLHAVYQANRASAALSCRADEADSAAVVAWVAQQVP